MRTPIEFTSTYKEMTDTIRRCIRPCWKCKLKDTEACDHCPPSRVLKDIIGMMSYANKKLKEEGINLSKKRKKELSHSTSQVKKEEKKYKNLWEYINSIYL